MYKRQTLDYSFTNFEEKIKSSEVCFPVESDTSKSDHNSVVYDCVLSRPATFAWETHEYLQMTPEGIEKFSELIAKESWDEVKDSSLGVDNMTQKFHDKLDWMVSKCFTWKRSRHKSNESPWLTEGLRSQIKKGLAIFKSEGRSIHWKRLDKCIKLTLKGRRRTSRRNLTV